MVEIFAPAKGKHVRWRFGVAAALLLLTSVLHAQVGVLDDLIINAPFAPVPLAPEGWRLRVLADLPGNPVRLASDGKGTSIYILIENGDVWRMDLRTRDMRRLIEAKEYNLERASWLRAQGIFLDAQNRLYVVMNGKESDVVPQMLRVTIYRTTSVRDGLPAEPKAWFRAIYPYGVGVFDHGASNIATGPDGFLYVSNGSRTDHGERGDEPHRSHDGEVELTACIWRLDPNSDRPIPEIYARGIRNAWGFCWDENGRMMVTENGPNADAPEELNFVERAKHYGFPYQFSDAREKYYPDQLDAPKNLKMELPIVNLGPAGVSTTEEALSTLEPHSSPSGVVYLGKEFPVKDHGTFLVARFGNLIGTKDVGYDVLQVRPMGVKDGRETARVTTFLKPISRPLDVHISGGKVYVVEFEGCWALPARLIELRPIH